MLTKTTSRFYCTLTQMAKKSHTQKNFKIYERHGASSFSHVIQVNKTISIILAAANTFEHKTHAPPSDSTRRYIPNINMY